jgi:hypothetical protein
MKKFSQQSRSHHTEVQPSIRVIKTATCKSLSGKSDLTYHLGVDEESNLHLRVFANSGSGYFSQEWVPYSAIQRFWRRRRSSLRFPCVRCMSARAPTRPVSCWPH